MLLHFEKAPATNLATTTIARTHRRELGANQNTVPGQRSARDPFGVKPRQRSPS
jgi:hypothetical protein